VKNDLMWFYSLPVCVFPGGVKSVQTSLFLIR
jgi:hypothetical protein